MAGSVREGSEALNDPRRKILLVEDEEPIRSLVEKLLVAAGHSVVSTGDPTAAVELVLSVGSGPRSCASARGRSSPPRPGAVPGRKPFLSARRGR